MLPRLPRHPCEWIQTGTKQWHTGLCREKHEISNIDFLLKAWLLQVKHLWKLWTHKVQSTSLSSTDNRSSETSLSSNKSNGILPICSHALFFPCGKHMVAFKLGTFLSQLCHRFQEWLCISHLAFVQFAGCRKKPAYCIFLFLQRGNTILRWA